MVGLKPGLMRNVALLAGALVLCLAGCSGHDDGASTRPVVTVLSSSSTLAVASSSAGAASTQQTAWFLQQARTGEAVHDEALVESAVARLRQLAPWDANIVSVEQRLALRQGRTEEAKRLRDRLCNAGAKSVPCIHATALLRLAGPDKQKLGRAQLFLAAGNGAKALQAFQALFGDDPPDFELAVEYWTAYGQGKNQQKKALSELQGLDQLYPGNIKLREALVRLLFAEDRDDEAMKVLGQLAGTNEGRGFAESREFAYLSDLRASDKSIAGWNRFLGRYPQSSQLKKVRETLKAQQKLMADPAWRAGLRGRVWLNRGHNAQAAKELRYELSRYPDNLEFLNDYGYALMRLGNRGGAIREFSKAMRLAPASNQFSKWQGLVRSNRYWNLLNAGDAALAQHQPAHAKRLYLSALRVKANGVGALRGMASVARAEHDNAQAERWLLKARRSDPADTGTIRDLVSLYQSEGRMDRLQALATTLKGSQRASLRKTVGESRAKTLRELAQAAMVGDNRARAQSLLRQAHASDPANNGIIRDLISLNLDNHRYQHVLDLLKSLPPSQQQQLAGLVKRVQVDALEYQAQQAADAGDTAKAEQLFVQARALAPDDPWIVYHLAQVRQAQGNTPAAEAAFDKLLAADGSDKRAHYAYALFLGSIDRNQDALSMLHSVPAAQWDQDMHQLGTRLVRAQARSLRANGHKEQAWELLASSKNLDDILILGDWSLQDGDYVRAERMYKNVLSRQPDNVDARLGLAETLVAEGNMLAARGLVNETQSSLPADNYSARRRLANILLAVGEDTRAGQIFDRLQQEDPTDPLVLRDAARVAVQHGRSQHALDLYSRAMSATGLITAGQAAPTRDDVAMTRASRSHDGDGWLKHGLRSAVSALYQALNSTVTVSHDYSWRGDSTTPGISDLQRNITIVNASAPVADGRGFLRLEHVNMDTGFLQTGADGFQHEAFGACALQWRNIHDNSLVPSGCPGVREAQSGYTLAAGWQGKHWGFDIGHSPTGFAVGNWLGGVSYTNDWADIGYTVTLSRRPIDSTLLSYAGVVDPMTGITYGGVTANGVTLGLSYDQGGAYGIWGQLQQHRLTGENVPSNNRFRAMGGLYYRVIDRANEQMRAGVSLMYWHYQKDLGQYTLGQAGYYSPQQYLSVGLPFRWSWRNGDWSIDLEGSAGWSVAHFSDSQLYPSDVLQKVMGPTVNPNDYQLVSGNLVHQGRHSNGLGLNLQAAFERRLSSHWVLGGRVSYSHSQDYSPSNATLYLRYYLDPWQGDLPLPVESKEPYADFR